VKGLREKLKEQRLEARRKEDKLAEHEAKVKRLEEGQKAIEESLK
jgi:exonuclease VII small subunit